MAVPNWGTQLSLQTYPRAQQTRVWFAHRGLAVCIIRSRCHPPILFCWRKEVRHRTGQTKMMQIAQRYRMTSKLHLTKGMFLQRRYSEWRFLWRRTLAITLMTWVLMDRPCPWDSKPCSGPLDFFFGWSKNWSENMNLAKKLSAISRWPYSFTRP